MKKPQEKQKAIAKKKAKHELKRAVKAKSRRRVVADLLHGKPLVVARYLKTKTL